MYPGGTVVIINADVFGECVLGVETAQVSRGRLPRGWPYGHHGGERQPGGRDRAGRRRQGPDFPPPPLVSPPPPPPRLHHQRPRLRCRAAGTLAPVPPAAARGPVTCACVARVSWIPPVTRRLHGDAPTAAPSHFASLSSSCSTGGFPPRHRRRLWSVPAARRRRGRCRRVPPWGTRRPLLLLLLSPTLSPVQPPLPSAAGVTLPSLASRWALAMAVDATPLGPAVRGRGRVNDARAGHCGSRGHRRRHCRHAHGCPRRRRRGRPPPPTSGGGDGAVPDG